MAVTYIRHLLAEHGPTALLVGAVVAMSATAWRAWLDSDLCVVDDLLHPRACDTDPVLGDYMLATLHREIDDGDDTREVAIRVEFGIHGRYIPATRVDPEEHPELEVESATRGDTGEDVELTDDEMDLLWSAANDARDAAAEDAAEARWEAQREARLYDAWADR